MALSDPSTLSAHYAAIGGATYERGDLNADEDVDLADLATLLSIYGTSCE